MELGDPLGTGQPKQSRGARQSQMRRAGWNKVFTKEGVGGWAGPEEAKEVGGLLEPVETKELSC